MAAYILSFEIHADSTYQIRYRSLVEKISELASGIVWDETTSFLSFSSNHSLQKIHDDIYFETDLSQKDKILVINLSTREYLSRHIEYPNSLASSLTG